MRLANPGRLVSALALVATMSACAQQPVNTAPAPTSRGGAADNSVGASSSRNALDGFLRAVKDQDLQAMSVLWGNQKGPGRDQFKRDELEKRLVIMQCLLMHDRWSLAESTPRLKAGGVQAWQVSLTRRRATAKTTLETIQGPGGRWYLTNADLAPLREFCQEDRG